MGPGEQLGTWGAMLERGPWRGHENPLYINWLEKNILAGMVAARYSKDEKNCEDRKVLIMP